MAIHSSGSITSSLFLKQSYEGMFWSSISFQQLIKKNIWDSVCARHCARTWKLNDEQNSMCSHKVIIWWIRQCDSVLRRKGTQFQDVAAKKMQHAELLLGVHIWLMAPCCAPRYIPTRAPRLPFPRAASPVNEHSKLTTATYAVACSRNS